MRRSFLRQSRPLGLARDHRCQRIAHRFPAAEWRCAREHFEQHNAESPDVGALIDRFPARLLGRHIGGCSQNHAGLGRKGERGRVAGYGARRGDGGFGGFRQTEIQQLHDTVGRDLDVRRLEIAMDHAFLMCGLQTGGDLARVGDRHIDGHRSAQVLAFDEFHHDGGLLDAVDGGNIRMIEGREHLRFTLEALHAEDILGERRRENLDGDVAAELRIGGAIHGHAARRPWRRSSSAGRWWCRSTCHSLRNRIEME